MRKNLMIAAATSALVLTLGSTSVMAQRGGGSGGMGGGPGGPGGRGGMTTIPQTTPTPRGDVDRTQDRLRDRTDVPDQDRDRTRDQDRDKDKHLQGAKDQDQDRDRDRLQTSRVVEDQLASLSLLTSAERTQMQAQMRAATTAEERNRIRAEHQKLIQERAREMGIEAPMGNGQGPGAGQGGQGGAGGQAGDGAAEQTRARYMLMTMLTEQERSQFMNRIRSATTEQQRETIRNEMRVTAQQRARETGVDVPDWFGRDQSGQ